MVGAPWGWSSSLPCDPKLSVKKITSKTKKIQQVFSCQCMFQVFSHTQKSPGPHFQTNPQVVQHTFGKPWHTFGQFLELLRLQTRGTSALAVPAKRQSGPTPDVGESPRFVVSFERKKTFKFYIPSRWVHPITQVSKWSEITAISRVVLFTPGKTPLIYRYFRVISLHVGQLL